MLTIGISSQRCAPGSAASSPLAAGPESCEGCGSPGGPQGQWLERHLVAKRGDKHLCPICHACLHLDVAGAKGLGKMIWLPELTQGQLNAMVLACFVTLYKKAIYERQAETTGVVAAAARIYKIFERRSDSVESMLGGSAIKAVLPRKTLSDPAHIAGLMGAVMRKHKLAPSVAAAKTEGLRLLAFPAPFEAYIVKASGEAERRYPVRQWVTLLAEAQAVLAKPPAVAASAEEVFDATAMAGG